MKAGHHGDTIFRVDLDGVIVYEVIYAPWMRIEPHAHQTTQLAVVDRGAMLETGASDDGTVLRPNGALMRPAGFQHVNGFYECETRGLIVDISEARWRRLAPIFRPPNRPAYAESTTLLPIYRRIRDEVAGRDAATNVALEGLVLEFVANLARSLTANELPDVVARARRDVADDPARRWKPEQFARDAGIAAPLFAEAFREAAGCSFAEYVSRQRVERAATLLRTTDRLIADIASDTGFYDQAHFTRWFKRVRGVTPQRFRAAAR